MINKYFRRSLFSAFIWNLWFATGICFVYFMVFNATWTMFVDIADTTVPNLIYG
jgi:Sec-independent protein secretion pathway component TatC